MLLLPQSLKVRSIDVIFIGIFANYWLNYEAFNLWNPFATRNTGPRGDTQCSSLGKCMLVEKLGEPAWLQHLGLPTGVLTVRSVPGVGILIIQDILRVGNLT